MSFFSTYLSDSFCYLPQLKISNLKIHQSILKNNPVSHKSQQEILNSMHKYTGILERRYALENQAASDLAIAAISPVLHNNLNLKKSLNALIVATTSGDYPSPATANWVHYGLQLENIVHCLDVSSSCTSFLSAFRSAFGFLRPNSSAIIVASELKHKSLNPEDIRTLSLFADGSAGVILKNGDYCNSQFKFAFQEINSNLAQNIKIPVGGSRTFYTKNDQNIYLEFFEPRKMYLHTVKCIVKAILKLWQDLESQSLQSKLQFIFVHQANINILKDVRQKLPSNVSSKIPSLMSDVGNTVCAALPMLRVRVKFLYSIICSHKKVFELKELANVFNNICKINEKFNYEIKNNSILFTTKIQHENIFIQDDGSSSLEEGWLTKISQEEFKFILDIAEQNEFTEPINGIDFWIGAGGGFQTLGIIHFYPK